MKKIVIISILFSFALIGCFSAWKGEEGIFSINFGGAQNNRVIIPWLNNQDIDLTHIITLNGGPDGPHTKTIPPSQGKAYFSVMPGLWNISVEAYEIKEDGKEIFRHLIAIGGKSINIKPGHNGTVIIQMRQPPAATPTEPPDNKIYLIADGEKTPYDTLADALNEGKNNEKLKAFTVSISDGMHFINSDFGGIIRKTVTIENRGEDTAYIKPGDPEFGIEITDCIFSVYDTLTLQGNITLEGVNDNNCALIVVNDGGTFNMGRLNMGDNIVITGNKNNNGDDLESSGGGVYVAKGAKYFMNGGTITGNTAYYGGGVCVCGGTFTMLDGIITDNTAVEGGGVYVNSDYDNGMAGIYGTFIMGDDKNGDNIKIYNNRSDDVYKGRFGYFYNNKGYVKIITEQ
jgi:hypothetical protein